MDSNRIYVPDSGKWISFFKKSLENKSIQSFEGKKDRSSASSTIIVPIDNDKNMERECMSIENADLTLVTPVAQSVQQAKLEIRREKKSSSNKRKPKRTTNHNGKKKKRYQRDNFD